MRPPLRAGKFNRRVALQKSTVSQDSTGATIDAWATQDTVWAAIEPIRGREYFDSQKVSSEVDVKIRIRHRSDIDATWRVSMTETATSPSTTRLFRIVAVINAFDGRQEIHLMCKEFDTGGEAV